MSHSFNQFIEEERQRLLNVSPALRYNAEYMDTFLVSVMRAARKFTLEEALEKMPKEKQVDEVEHARKRYNEDCICDICDDIARNHTLSEVRSILSNLLTGKQ